jgi:pyruvate,orthophosphate dikinase
MEQRIYYFGDGGADGDASMRQRLGGKGANLAEMSRLGLPVPPGFTVSTAECLAYQGRGRLSDGLMDEVRAMMARLEASTGKRFGDPANPLLVSVRSGAAISMPGMMDTVLNLGLNPAVVEGLALRSGSPRFAADAYRRFIQMYGDVVRGVSGAAFEEEMTALKASRGVTQDTELSADDLNQLIRRFREIYREGTGEDFPEDPFVQLEQSISAVFGSWNTPRAATYRRLNRIPNDLGTAVNVQTMVFGNLGEGCGTGVGFTRNPATGEPRFYGEYLPNAQGEDVVAGTRTPLPVQKERAEELGLGGRSLEEQFPGIYAGLMAIARTLEDHYTDLQDLEFTFEGDKLYLLQTRTGKRTGRAWLRTQVDMVAEGRITPRQAVQRVPASSLPSVLAPTLAHGAAERARHDGRLLATGLNAGPGAATGRVAFTADEAEERAARGEAVILVREETTPDDIHGIHAALGVITARGGMTSHAAVVARGMGKPCIVGCDALQPSPGRRLLRIGEEVFGPGDVITMDGTTGRVYRGELAIMPSEILQVTIDGTLAAEDSSLYQAFSRLMSWADELRTMGVRANADTPEDARVAVALGAEGVGLCRTEHMFLKPDRLLAMRRMILAATRDEREAALAQIEPMQIEDFRGLFRAMGSRPVTVRTLDPPLHEFLPHGQEETTHLARELNKPFSAVQRRVQALRESNPMLGHRGCRLGIDYPEITRMQTRAILTAALDVRAEGIDVHPEVMVPLVGHVEELRLQKAEILAEAEALFERRGERIVFSIGTMIEVPRAALTAGQIAAEAAFFSFGTNDLTQMTLGVSRDDAGSFLPGYVERGIYAADPFASLDLGGPGRLVRMAAEDGRAARPDLKLGICGEHGGDPDTVAFCHEVGLDYVSCSPFRVPIARLAAAHAALQSSD